MSAAGKTVLVARPLWPVLRRVLALFPEAGYCVEEAPSWDRLLESTLSCAGLCGVVLGEGGDARGEMEVLRRFRERNGARGVPVAVVGGMNALLRANAFQAAGADLVLPADLGAGELVERLRPLLRYGALYQDAAERARQERERSMRDELTGLPNRRHFSLDVERNMEFARRTGRPLSCIIIDIDDFRKVNERYGREAGDGVIRQVGGMIEKTRRRYDSVARLGGDEFGWLLVDADGARALRAAERAHRLLSERLFDGVPDTLHLTATMGVSSLLPGADLPSADLVGNADRALYWGKETGKNAVRFFPPEKTS